MDLTKIIAVSGYPGLFKVIAQAHNGIIVESLIDKKRMQAFNSFKISTLEDISVFTLSEDVPVKEVLKKIMEKEGGKACPDPKSSSFDLKGYFKEVLPNYDEERVHTSDMKKILVWYNLLQQNDLLNTAEESTSDTGEDKSSVKKTGKETLAKTSAVKSSKTENTKAKTSTARAPRKTATVRKTGA